jgi:hypothetical protein
MIGLSLCATLPTETKLKIFNFDSDQLDKVVKLIRNSYL